MTRILPTCAAMAACLFLLAGCGGISISPPTTADNADSGQPVAPNYTPPPMPMGGAAGGHGGSGGHGAPNDGMAMAQTANPAGGGHGAGPAGYADPGAAAGHGVDPAGVAGVGHGADPAMAAAAGDPAFGGAGAGHGAAGANPGAGAGHGAAGANPGAGAGHGANAANPGGAAGHGAAPDFAQQQREAMGEVAGQAVPDAGQAGFGPADRAAMERELAGQGAEGAAAAEGGPAGIPGYPGEGGSGSNQFEEGSAERAIADFVAAVNAGDLETAGKMVGSRATSQLAAIREGRLSENQLQQLQSYFSTLDHIGRRVLGLTVQSNFNGGSNKLLLFETQKEREGFVITKLTIRDAPATRGTSNRSRRR